MEDRSSQQPTSHGQKPGLQRIEWPAGSPFARVYEDDGAGGTTMSIQPIPRPPPLEFVKLTDEEMIRTMIRQDNPALACHIVDAQYPFAFEIIPASYGTSTNYPRPKAADGTELQVELPRDVLDLYIRVSNDIAHVLDKNFHRGESLPGRVVFWFDRPKVIVQKVRNDSEAEERLAELQVAGKKIVGEGRLIDWNARLEECLEAQRRGTDD